METTESWLKRIEATEAWLKYVKLYPNSDVDVYDYSYKGYSYEEIRDIFLQASRSRRQLYKKDISKKPATQKIAP